MCQSYSFPKTIAPMSEKPWVNTIFVLENVKISLYYKVVFPLQFDFTWNQTSSLKTLLVAKNGYKKCNKSFEADLAYFNWISTVGGLISFIMLLLVL